MINARINHNLIPSGSIKPSPKIVGDKGNSSDVVGFQVCHASLSSMNLEKNNFKIISTGMRISWKRFYENFCCIILYEFLN